MLPETTKNKLIKNEELTLQDNIPNPIVIYNKNNINIANEMILHNLILEDIVFFMR